MSRRDDAGETFRTVEDRFAAHRQANPRPRGRTALRIPVVSDRAERTLGMAVGFGTGALLLALALVAALAAASWAEVDRSGAVVGYALVTFFLVVAGLGALIGTWIHAFRVTPSEGPGR
jgi:hypothetical protein